MRSAGGYVRVYRSLLDWEWYDDDACVRMMIHLLLTVNWEPKEWHGQKIAPGQIVTSMEKLAEKLRVSRSAVRRTLDKLKSTGDITVRTNNHWTTISLENWGEYQEVQPTNDRPKRQQPTDRRPTADRPAATTKEGEELEEGEEGKNESSPNGEPADRRNPQVQLVVDFFKEALGGRLDGTVKRNRFDAYTLIKRMKDDYPDHDPVVTVQALIRAAREDPFHKKNATSFRYLVDHSRAIIEARQARANNPKTQSDGDYTEQVIAAAERRFANRA